ncbi:MAG: NAD(P)H-dependent oxidoreductase subunit E, partial [Selenomonadaceae bacterium]|nr:NAD(P)H-dependent oxidoreductase subunit E [Selenomonadaceae bacterium]
MLTAQKVYPLPKELQAKIDLVLESHDYDSTQIVGILLEVQDLNPLHYVPEPVAYYLADRLDMRITNIFDILNFYSELSDKPRAKYPIQVCSSIACRVNDSEGLANLLKDILGIDFGETTYDQRFTLEKVTCFGACDRAPAVRINGKVYDHLDSREKIEHLLQTL